MSVYHYTNEADSGQARINYNPERKKQLIMDNILPLASLYDITDRRAATFVICMA
jgi:hypothetical protein